MPSLPSLRNKPAERCLSCPVRTMWCPFTGKCPPFEAPTGRSFSSDNAQAIRCKPRGDIDGTGEKLAGGGIEGGA